MLYITAPVMVQSYQQDILDTATRNHLAQQANAGLHPTKQRWLTTLLHRANHAATPQQ